MDALTSIRGTLEAPIAYEEEIVDAPNEEREAPLEHVDVQVEIVQLVDKANPTNNYEVVVVVDKANHTLGETREVPGLHFPPLFRYCH